MRGSRLVRVGALMLIVLCGAVPAAAADVRQGAQGWEAPEAPSLDGRAPLIERERAIDTVTVRFDDMAGTLTVTTRLYAPQVWGPRLGRVEVTLGTDCDQDPVTLSYSSDIQRVYPDDESAPSYDAVQTAATMTLDGYEGQAPGTVSFDGTTFTTSYTHEALKDLDLRCVHVRQPDATSYESFYLDGYAPLKLTAANATRDFKDLLHDQYGTLREAYVKCANLWTDQEGEGTQYADCMAHFRVGRRYHYVSTAAQVEGENYMITYPAGPFHRSWTRKWRKQGPKCLRNAPFGRLSGTLYSNDTTCPARMASEIYKGVTGWHGTGTGSFPQIVRYNCRKRARTYTCRNRLGDAFRWTPAH